MNMNWMGDGQTMATKRSRLIDDSHPVARYLFQAADLQPPQSLTLDFATPRDALRASWRLRAFRDRGKLAPPDTFERTKIDPQGEGVGHFDNLVISHHGKRVTIMPEQASAMPEPVSVQVEGLVQWSELAPGWDR
jgi:hypothetical protein